ncbi:MAG: hypothetical protein FGF50_01815 [Candidatus Brockarchaeota archaeon]|nr:hypothetical protein [Candidatus Brockarchaeota archaeon]
MPEKALAIIISILLLTSHFDAILHLQAHGEKMDALAALREIEEELEKGEMPSGSIIEANFIVPEGFPAELAKRLWLFIAQLVSTGCSENEIREAIINANDILKLPAQVYYELKNYTIIPKYDEARIIRSDNGSVSVEIPYKVIDGSEKDVDASSVKYESNGTSLFHVLHRYPKRRTYLVRVIDPDAYTLTFIDLKTGEVFNKTARINIGLFSNVTQGYFGFESFIVAVPGHFEETREVVKSQVREFRVLLPAHDPLVVDTSISPTKVKVGDVITVSAQIRNPQEAKDFKVLLGIKFSDKDAFEAWAPPPEIISGYLGQPIYLYLRPKRPGVYQVTIYFAVVEPRNLDVVFWNGGKTVTYDVTVFPDAPRLRVEVEAEALAKFANLTITLVNTGGQKARDVKLSVTGDVEEKKLEIGRVWHTWEGNIITKLLSPIAKVNVTVVYYDLDDKRHTSTSLMTISTTNFVTPEEWRTYLVEVPGYEETKRVFIPSYQGATQVKLYLMKNCLAPPPISFFNGLSLIPISPNGFTLTLENASNIEVPEVRYMLLDVKPRFLCERVLREDEVKKLFHINEDERLEPNKIPAGYEVRLLKEEVLNQSEIVTVSDDFYEQLKYDNWKDHDYKYEDTGVKKWDLDKAIAKVSRGKTLELVYRPLACQGDLVKGVLVKNYASRDMAYELEVLQGPIAEAPPGNSVLSVPAYGSIPLNLIQLESVNFPVFIRLKYQGRLIASLQVFATGRVPEFWRGFWDGVKEKLPGIIVTATIIVILAVPTHGGSLLAYVKDLMASAVIPSLMAVGVASNIREVFEAYSAYKKIDEVAEELDGFSQRAAYAGYLNTYSFFQGLRSRIKENQGVIVGTTALDLLADVTIRDLLVTFGREDAGEYEKGKALGRLVGSALSLATYVGIYYKFLSNGPKLLSHAGRIKEFLKGVYNWITPPLWDAGVAAGKLTARGIAASLAFSEESDDFRQRLNGIKDDEGSLSSLAEFTGRYLDDALDVSSRLGLSEGAFLGLLWAYGKYRRGEETLSKFIQEIESIGKKSKKCVNELLSSICDAEDNEVEHIILNVVPKLVESSSDELEGLEKLLTSGVGIKEIEIVLEKTSELKDLLAGMKEFGFGKPHKVTLKKGEDCTLCMGKGNELEPGTYKAKIYWECIERSGVMEFWIAKEAEPEKVSISKSQVNQVLEKIGKDEAEILITKAEFFDYRLFFPKEFLISEVEMKLDLYNNKIELNGKSYEFELLRTYIRDGKLHVCMKFQAKNIWTGKELALFLSEDRSIGILLGEKFHSAEGIGVDNTLGLIEIMHEGRKAEYSFNLRSLKEQLREQSRYSYEILLEDGQSGAGLKRVLRRILGYDAEIELEESIGSEYGIAVGFDNGKKAYTGSSELLVKIPEGADKIEWIEIVSIKDEIPSLLQKIIKAGGSQEVAGEIGEVGARIVIKEEGEGEIKAGYRRHILTKLLEKMGIPLDKFDKLNNNVDLVYTGKGGKKAPDATVEVIKDFVINGVVFKKGEIIAIIEVKSSVSGKSPEELCKMAIGEEGLKKYVGMGNYKDTKYGIAVGFSYDPTDVLVGEPGEIKVEVVELRK